MNADQFDAFNAAHAGEARFLLDTVGDCSLTTSTVSLCWATHQALRLGNTCSLHATNVAVLVYAFDVLRAGP